METKLIFENVLAELKSEFGSGMISLNKAAKWIGVDYRTLVNDSTFPIKQVGKRYKVPLVSLARWAVSK